MRVITCFRIVLCILPGISFGQAGTLDNTFSSDGMVTTSVGSGQDVGRAVALQSDGKIVVAGFSRFGFTSGDFALARYNTDGSLDASFSNDGKVNTDFGGTDKAYSVAIQQDGKIVAVGEGNGDFAIARYIDVGDPEDLIIYPNPVYNIFQTSEFEFQEAELEIYNYIGQSVYQMHYSSQQQVSIDVSSLETGIYFVVVMNEKGNKAVRKFVKM